MQRQREGKKSSRFHGVTWKDEKGVWQAFYWKGQYIHIGTYAEETTAALAYNKAIKDAGLEGKKNLNPVDAYGKLILPGPKP